MMGHGGEASTPHFPQAKIAQSPMTMAQSITRRQRPSHLLPLVQLSLQLVNILCLLQTRARFRFLTKFWLALRQTVGHQLIVLLDSHVLLLVRSLRLSAQSQRLP